jgi:hypothetical protein
MQAGSNESGNMGNLSHEHCTAMCRSLPGAFEIDGV